ncbi:hypothetical protein [Blautia sp. AM23-13AC]
MRKSIDGLCTVIEDQSSS